MLKKQTWRHFDFLLFSAVIILCIFGVAMVRSATAGNAELAGSISRQMIFIGISLVVILIAAAVDYHYWASLTWPMYIFAIASLLITFVVGTALYGSARWLDTGLILIQPSELAKIIMIIVLAGFFSSQRGAEKICFGWRVVLS